MATQFDHLPIRKCMDNLAARWAYESQYEDFKDYVSAARVVVTSCGAVFKSMTKKPFACKYTTPGVEWTCKVNNSSVEITGVKL